MKPEDRKTIIEALYDAANRCETRPNIDAALDLLRAEPEAREPVAWMRIAGVGRSEYVHPEAKKNCPECWSEYNVPLYTHPQ